MALYTIKNLLLKKDILKTLQSSGISNYIEMRKLKRSTKAAAKELD